MAIDLSNFELDYKGGKINVSRHTAGTQVVYSILFSDQRPLLVITSALHANVFRFWTSVPEGRQPEAEEIGALISDYFKTIS